jgi:hypothetical protein
MTAARRDRDDEQAVLKLAAEGDEGAFRELVEPYRAELRAHCYRMLGSLHDAEDALQDALLRAWRGLAGFEGRGSVRSWLYSIATNAAVDITRHRSRRELPVSFGPAAGPGGRLEEPLTAPRPGARNFGWRTDIRSSLVVAGSRCEFANGSCSAGDQTSSWSGNCASIAHGCGSWWLRSVRG